MKFPRYVASLLAACSLLLSLSALAQTVSQSQNAVEELAAAYKRHLQKKVVTLRKAYTSTSQHFDENGQLGSQSSIGPWTLYGRFLVEDVKIKGQQLRFEGKRVWVKFNGEEIRDLVPASGDNVEINIDLVQGPDAVKQASAAVQNILLPAGMKMSDIMPDDWRPYFERREAGKPQLNLRDQLEALMGQKPLDGKPVPSLAHGVTNGLLIEAVRPKYPAEARAARVSGEVKLIAVIGKDGRIHSLAITKPVGVGLDDAAIKSVKKWRFRPYYVDGVARTVETSVQVNFTPAR